MRVVAAEGAGWEPVSGLALVDFEQSQGVYWLQFVAEGERVSAGILAGRDGFGAAGFGAAQVAFVGELPAGAEEFQDVYGLALVRSGWVRSGWVAVGRGGCEVVKAGFEKWRRVEAKHHG